ncbi:MAG TPA: hypothetical protein VMG10_06725 [Gemmataceae bacterium]|nr:hypothetical protein [Gemmataceae bacterium]
MRVSSLSDRRVIELIRKYFVPAWVSRDFYQIEGDNNEEKAEIARLDDERRKRGLKGGTVCVFIVAPNGDVLATQIVQLAYKPENLIPFLQKIIADLKLKPRSEEAIRASAAEVAEAKPKTKDGRLIHIWTRVDTGKNRGLSNDRVELTAAEWKAFLPPADANPGASWEIPEKIVHKLYQYGYPPTPYWRATDCKVVKGTLKARLAALSGKETRIELEGQMELSFPYGKPMKGRVTARFAGVLREDREKKTLASLMLVSEKADYVWYWQGKPQPLKMRIALELEP